ncbi:DUF2937 family protein [Roseibium litorale]|uniref:DUF2937 family protein n=1 Tax=Roseibium litorale TaxID=2803841 RepID=A0ABR9CSJ6_9HYPH|nr:DUF2937 family protein [Roseibium litorale]MBD8893835.1 DUF2937 family protein [Roseibium litorale]
MLRIIMLAVMLVTGGTASQLPEFAQQYRQRLGGTIDALAEVMADFRTDAESFGLSPDEALQRMRGGQDLFIRQRGDTLARTQERLEKLRRQQLAMATAGPFARIVIFAENADPALAKATAADFEPAVPVTTEGLASAGLGAFAGLLLMRLLQAAGRPLKRIRLRRSHMRR